MTEHNNDSTLPVSDHLPEISGRRLHGTLSYDVCSLLLVALDECGNSTIAIAVASIRCQIDTGASSVKDILTYMDKSGIDVVWGFSFQHNSHFIHCVTEGTPSPSPTYLFTIWWWVPGRNSMVRFLLGLLRPATAFTSSGFGLTFSRIYRQCSVDMQPQY